MGQSITYLALLSQVDLILTSLLCSSDESLEILRGQGLQHVGAPLLTSFRDLFFGWEVVQNIGPVFDKGQDLFHTQALDLRTVGLLCLRSRDKLTSAREYVAEVVAVAD